MLPDVGLATLVVAPTHLNELKGTRGTFPPHQQPIVVATGSADGGATTSCLDGNNPLKLQGCLGE
eukprot:3707673-Alexandrium_andersonii.AAC.1